MQYKNEQSGSQAHPSHAGPLSFDINTGFATDFLNQYNELKMALEMAPAMPEILEDFENWTPKTYVNYFKTSECRDKDAILYAFQSLPIDRQKVIDEAVAATNQNCIKALAQVMECTDTVSIAAKCANALNEINTGLGRIKMATQGQTSGLDQSSIDDLFAA